MEVRESFLADKDPEREGQTEWTDRPAGQWVARTYLHRLVEEGVHERGVGILQRGGHHYGQQS